MKRMQTWRWVLAALLLVAGGITGWAEDLVIPSSDGPGRLTFNEVSTAKMYRVEWAPSSAGPWTNFTGAAGAALDTIVAKGAGVVTAAVPMVYRVVAMTSSAYLMVDLTGSTNYPVTPLYAIPPGGWTDEHKTTKLVLRRIPATTGYPMGSPTNEVGRDPDETQHLVTLTKDFYIGVFEVTQRQWELVMGNKPAYFTNATHYETRPVEQVSYYDIRENPANSDDPAADWPNNGAVNVNSFMGKLRAKTGLSGFDLPTESQWEYAGRAGTTTALNNGNNLTNSFIDDRRMDILGRYTHNGGSNYVQHADTSGGTAKVGSYLPNVWGLYDFHGNVFEWCLDGYGTYPGTVTDPKGAPSESRRILRGGCWLSYGYSCRSAFRHKDDPNERSYVYGFRVCFVP
jgi:formylglycine-generating enzyme required for sulfatase activity